MNDNQSSSAKSIVIVSLLLIFIGGLLAWWIQTGGNTIKIKDVRFVGGDGRIVSALLYIPPGVSAKKSRAGHCGDAWLHQLP